MAFRNAFQDVEEKHGGHFHEDSGWEWTEGFADDPDASKGYTATREDVSVWNVSPLIKWKFVGPDAAKALDFLGTNKAIDLKVGGVRYSLLLDDNGKMMDEGTLYRVADDTFYYMINTDGDGMQKYFEGRVAGMDVTITDVSKGMPNIAVQGPRSREVVQKLAPSVDLAGLKYFNFIPEPVEVAGAQVMLTRTGYSGELGYELFLMDTADCEKVYDAVVAEGATKIGTDAVLRYRAESGLVIMDVDYAAGETNPYDVGLDHAIKLDHDFVGKSAIEADAANPANRYVTLKLDTDEESGYGSTVLHDGKEVGVGKSPASSLKYGSITLATVPTGLSAPGTNFEVVWEVEGEGEKRANAVSDVVPLYDTEKKRPRS